MTTHPFISLRTVDRMDDPKTTDSVTIPVSVPADVAHPRHQRSVPDVPEDIEDEIILHFNDPNWDFRDTSPTLPIPTDGVALQRFSTISSHIGTRTEGQAESRVSPWHTPGSRADFSSEEQVQFRDLSFPSCVAFCSSRSFSSGIHHTLRSAQPSRTPTTQQQCP